VQRRRYREKLPAALAAPAQNGRVFRCDLDPELTPTGPFVARCG
jgi:hypothetical protein